MAVPMTVEPEAKVTLPVGVVPLPVTVALRVTDCPTLAGFGEACSAVDEALPVTVSVAKPDSIPPQVRASEYTPVVSGAVNVAVCLDVEAVRTPLQPVKLPLLLARHCFMVSLVAFTTL